MDNIKRFENQPIRTAWDEEKEEWYFSVSDVVEILSESTDVKQYIKKMRSRDAELNAKWGTICTPVRMMTADGKNRKINAARLDQSAFADDPCPEGADRSMAGSRRRERQRIRYTD